MKFPWNKNTSATVSPAVFQDDAGLTVRNVSVTGESGTETITILKDISVKLTAPKTAVLGLNGSGKSTFLKLFNGLTEPAAGTVTVDNVDVESHLVEIRQRVGLLFSDPQAQLIMPTPLEDIELSLQKDIPHPDERKARATALLTDYGLETRRFSSVYDLSGGEKQLTALVAVLAVSPRVLLLDEPTTLLDLRNKLKLMNLLDELPQQMVISTHDLELAERCDEALIIHSGKLIAQGEAQQIISLYRTYCATSFPAE